MRPGVVAVLLVLFLMASVLVAPTRAQGAAQSPLEPDSGAMFGMWAKPKDGDWTQAGIKRRWNHLQDAAGRNFDVGHYYYDFGAKFPTWREQWHVDNGRIPLVSWADVKVSNVINGSKDSIIQARADDVKAFGEDIFVRWFWEMDGNKNKGNAESPSKYIDAWRHIVQIFRNRGADNAHFVWCPNAWAFKSGEAQDWYPGDQWVDWLCADGYNWAPGRPSAEWRDLGEIFEDFHDWAAPRNKPMMIGETGVMERAAGEKAAWYRQAVIDLKTELPEIDLMMLYDSDTIYDWWVDTTPGAFNAWKEMVNDPYLNGGNIFSDTFDAGLGNWALVDGAVIDHGQGDVSGAPSAKLASSGSGSLLRASTSGGRDAVCVDASVKIGLIEDKLTLIRLQNDPGVSIARVYVHPDTKELWVKSEKSGKKRATGQVMPLFEWKEITFCATRGGDGGISLEYEGSTVIDWDTRVSNKRIRGFRIGQGTGTYTVRFDDVEAYLRE